MGFGNSKPDIIERNNIKTERSDKRGTMNDDATIEYIQKAKDCTCYIINEKIIILQALVFFVKFLIQKIKIFF